jgi:divalent metal cation (Fe/Co/Zn/Cd) transporter
MRSSGRVTAAALLCGRHAGRVTFIDFDLVVPGEMSVSQVHDICDRIERALRTTWARR